MNEGTILEEDITNDLLFALIKQEKTEEIKQFILKPSNFIWKIKEKNKNFNGNN